MIPKALQASNAAQS